MKNTRNVKENRDPIKKNEHLVEVLYQKLGDRWFAFSLINDEVFVGSICQEELEKKIDSHSELKKMNRAS